jgi:ketosteroid isomerase-like protein
MNSDVVLEFIQAINCADSEKLLELMTEDHVFIDSQDNKMTGKNKLLQAWKAYFGLFPDYKVEANEIIEKNSVIFLFGYASGTYKNKADETISNHWRIPAAWKAAIEENKIKSWQVYADNSIVIEIIKRNI